jgi:hypothetical protein
MSEDYKDIGVYNRQPKNVNELLENKFTFAIRKLPEVSFKCRSANIPATSLPVAWQKTNLNPIPHSGLNIEYQPQEIEFIVDEDLNNYVELVNWMRKLAMPVNSSGYSDLKANGIGSDPNRGLVSDAVLVILTNESIPNIVCFFRDAFPISLSEIRFTNNTDNPDQRVAIAQFAYTWYDLMSVDEPEYSKEQTP